MFKTNCCPSNRTILVNPANSTAGARCCSVSVTSTSHYWKADENNVFSCCPASYLNDVGDTCCYSPNNVRTNNSVKCCDSTLAKGTPSFRLCCSSSTDLLINSSCCPLANANNVNTRCCGVPSAGQTWNSTTQNECCPSSRVILFITIMSN